MPAACPVSPTRSPLVSPDVSQAPHTSACFSPDLGWPRSLPSAWLWVVPASPFHYSQPKPFSPVFCPHVSPIHPPTPYQYPAGLPILLGVPLSPCPHILGRRANRSSGISVCCSDLCMSSQVLTCCLAAFPISQPLPPEHRLPAANWAMSHCPSPPQRLACSRFGQGHVSDVR